MAKGKCNLTVNGKVIRANLGETLIDAALGGRVVVPHDCCSGQCETCRVTVLNGDVDDAGSLEKNTVLGCIATLEGDAEIAFDPVPVVRNTRATVESIETMSDGLLEVRVRTARPLPWLPGQYVRARFAGYPARDYSPTFPLDLNVESDIVVFHVTVYPNSRVSSKLGREIGVGHRVTLKGPFGNAYLRHQSEPMVLASTGTGFAPIWSIAVSATMGQPGRPLRIIAGSRYAADLYMSKAVDWLRQRGVSVTLTAGDGDGVDVLTPRPSELLGDIGSRHIVYAAGSPSQVDAVRRRALAVDARFYADPFFAADETRSLRDWAASMFRRSRRDELAPMGGQRVSG